MKKVKTKSLEHSLKAISEIKNKAAELSKFEDSIDHILESLNNPESKSFTWIENSPVCTKIIDLDFNLKYMSKAGVNKLKIKDISSYYGKPYPLNFYSDSFKIPMKECMNKVLKTKEPVTHEASILDVDGNELWFESTLIPIKDNEENIDYLLIVSQDISERKHIELQIKQSKKFHETLLKTTPDIIYVYDLNKQKNVYTNNGNLKVLGYTMNEIDGFGSELLSKIMHPDDFKTYNNKVLPKYNKLKKGEIIELEYRAQHKNGSWRWLYSRESVFKRENGKAIQVIGVTGDITQRKKIELDLKQSKEKLKEALEITQLATFVFDDSTDFFETSSIGNKILGLDNLYKRDIQGWINLVHPEDLKEIEGLLDNPNSNYVVLDFRIIRPKDKKTIWISGYAKKEFNKEGVRTKITGTFQDVSYRKLAEQKLKAAQKNLNNTFNLSPSIIAKVDLGKKYTKVNLNTSFFIETSPAVERILGFTPNEFTARTITNFLHPDDVQRTTDIVSKKINDKKQSFSFENRFLCKNGTYKWISWQSTFPNEDGIVNTVGSDIDDKKHIEQKLKKSAKIFERWKSSNFIGIIQSNKSGEILDANDTLLNMLGFSKKEMKAGIDWKKLTPPEFSNKAELAMKEAKEKGYWTPFEKEYFHKDGHRIPVLVGGSTLNDARNEYIVFVINLTENKKIENNLKESEEFLNLTGELAKVGGWESDLTTGNTKWSKETKSIHEINDDRQPTIDEVINFYHKDDRALVNKHVTSAIKNNTPFNFEARIITQKGNLKYVKAFGQPVFENNQCIRLFGAIQDITDRKIIELELEEYRKDLETQNVLLKKEMSLSFNFEDMVYSSAKMSDVFTMVEQVAKTDANVLILGETGTGKELIAKAIHKISDRKNNSLIRVNCGAIPTELIESELFGHVKGSFTGAINNRLGKFELADGGTLFLDEIGELPLSLQPKLLRAIQEGEIEPIGSSKLKKLNVRIIAATNKNLNKEIKEKRFREDLYFRLNVFPIRVPPLRERIDDIAVLTEFFMKKYSKKYKKSIKYISDITMQQLKYYNWPGNVRELENLIERAVIVSNSNILVMSEFEAKSANTISGKNVYRITLEQVQKDHILKTLNDTNWKIDGKDGAAELLDIKPSTLRDRMKKFGIKRP